MKSTILWLLTLFFAFSAHAEGNGSSGGGHIYGDQLNPWFLSNTVEAHYCVEVSPIFSELSVKRVQELVTSAIKEWANIFAGLRPFGQDWKVTNGALRYVLDPVCQPSTDIKFQMGFLDREQRENHPEQEQLVGLASRTSYDPVSMRAKGFIYIAPESGPDRPRTTNMTAKPWSQDNGGALRYALIHEVGHIFGLQDDFYVSGERDVMGASFVDKLTSRWWAGAQMHRRLSTSSYVYGCNGVLDQGIPLGTPVNVAVMLAFGINGSGTGVSIMGTGKAFHLYQHDEGRVPPRRELGSFSNTGAKFTVAQTGPPRAALVTGKAGGVSSIGLSCQYSD